jgi:hypothetical protein
MCPVLPAFDAGVDATSDVGAVSELVDAGAPPSDCIPPCLWEVVKNCPRVGRCASQPSPSRSCGCWGKVACWPTTERWELTTDCTTRQYRSVYIGDRLCYREEMVASLAGGYVSWSDASGDFAIMFVIPLGSPPGDFLCESEGVSYGINPGAAHCAPWWPYLPHTFQPTADACASSSCCGEPPAQPDCFF